MIGRTPRTLLIVAAAILVVGATLHAAAFLKASAVVDASDLPLFYRASSKVLWLADSAAQLILAAILSLLVTRPQMGGRPLLILLALFPISSAILLYAFVGNFFAGHLMVAIAGLIVTATLLQAPGIPRQNH